MVEELLQQYPWKTGLLQNALGGPEAGESDTITVSRLG